VPPSPWDSSTAARSSCLRQAERASGSSVRPCRRRRTAARETPRVRSGRQGCQWAPCERAAGGVAQGGRTGAGKRRQRHSALSQDDVVLERGSGKAHLEVARAPAVVHRAVSPSDTAQKTLQTGQPRRRSERRCTWGRAPPRPKGRLSPRQPFAHRSSWVQPKVRPSRSASLLYARVTRATRGAPQPTNEAPP
jgi:hypothetical protein